MHEEELVQELMTVLSFIGANGDTVDMLKDRLVSVVDIVGEISEKTRQDELRRAARRPECRIVLVDLRQTTRLQSLVSLLGGT